MVSDDNVTFEYFTQPLDTQGIYKQVTRSQLSRDTDILWCNGLARGKIF